MKHIILQEYDLISLAISSADIMSLLLAKQLNNKTRSIAMTKPHSQT